MAERATSAARDTNPVPVLVEPRERPLRRWLDRFSHSEIDELSLNLAPRRFPPARHRKARDIEVSRFRVPIAGLGRELDGLRIVHLTDIHHGLYFSAEALVAAVELANSLDADVVALTGDYVSYSRNFAHSAAEILGGLRARRGVFAVLGNHDFRVGADLITRALRRSGIAVLRNRHTVIRAGGAQLHVAGVDDLWYKPNLPRALQRIPRGRPVVLLSHNPRIVPAAAYFSVDLVLSGHTHGGQVRLPFLERMRDRNQQPRRFHTGWDSWGRTRVYVSRGIGTIVLPVRVACPPEMPVFTLDALRAPR
ncbi:MAG TPA: metallophosphoesterase [Candidatus Acidoferrales bacterium]|nr:metallophosphoesterase [Candidatus Acidoferrales bacterium]